MNDLEKKPNVLQSWLAFHEDEDGMETIQVVMLIAIAAVVLIVLKAFWGEIKTWVKGLWNEVRNDGDSKQW
jgi:Flp pilus assembly pilin Flp